MMHLTGISSNAQSARHMTGIAGSASKTNSNVFRLNSQKSEEEDNAVTRLQSQINTLRERVQSIAENDSLDAKTKGELTQSVREQMAELTQQLNQRRMELRQEELEKEEEEQSAGKAPEKEPSETDGKAKYDTFTEDDELSGLSNAMLSAAKSVKLSRVQQSAISRKEGQIGVLESQAKKDTRLVGRTVPAGLAEKQNPAGNELAEAENAAPDEDKITLTKSKAEANIQDVTEQLSEREAAGVDLPRPNKIYTLMFEKIWEVSRGAAVEAKEEEAAELRSDIRGVKEDQARSLGDANRAVNGRREAAEESSDADLQAEAHVIKGIYGSSNNGKIGLAGLTEDEENALEAYA
ncbi:MAG: hypothetical protein NC394_10285 [Bacteroides sp.]|nr:hypothetical protein [Bacteroides sp.]